ncbi:hypothetical protein RQP46_001632 [Phenoliferia psychrophenolica]
MEEHTTDKWQDHEKTSNAQLEDPLSVSEVTHSLPWTTWMVVFACATWNGTISCTQITCLFWSSAFTATLGGAAEGLWLGQSFQVVTAVLGPVLARIGDSCGRRYVILLGIFFGALGSLIMALATDINMAIAGASLFGLSYGSGGNVFSVSSEVLPRAHRGTAQVMTLFGAIFGVLIGLYAGANLILTHPGNYPGWRSASWLNFALHVFTFALFAIFYHPRAVANPSGFSVLQRIGQIDLVGCALLAAGICPFIAVEGLIYNVFTHFFAVETALLWDARPYFLATRFAAFVFAAAITAPLYGLYVYRFKDAKAVLLFGYGAFLAGLIGMATVTLGTNKVSIIYCVLCGIGFAAPLVFLNMVTQLAVKPELMGLATSLIISSRSIGGAVGIAICGAVFTSKATVKIPAYVIAAVVKAGLPAASIPAVVGGIAGSKPAMYASAKGVTPAIIAAGKRALLLAYTDSLRFIWIVAIPFVVLGIVGLMFLQSTVHAMDATVDRPIETSRHKELVSDA